jgi:hypothetical protein
MSNEIIFFQIAIWASKISIIFTYESKNSKIYPMWGMFYQNEIILVQNSQKIHFLKLFILQ